MTKKNNVSSKAVKEYDAKVKKANEELIRDMLKSPAFLGVKCALKTEIERLKQTGEYSDLVKLPTFIGDAINKHYADKNGQ